MATIGRIGKQGCYGVATIFVTIATKPLPWYCGEQLAAPTLPW